jgi:hypothetical protein
MSGPAPSDRALLRLHLDQLPEQLLPRRVFPAISFANHFGDLHCTFGPFNLDVFYGTVASICVVQPELDSEPCVLPDLVELLDLPPPRIGEILVVGELDGPVGAMACPVPVLGAGGAFDRILEWFKFGLLIDWQQLLNGSNENANNR